ncbi:MAG: cupin domain-containing protein [Fimbriimonadaceae bacterium]|nr:cupin domain-containing protein [Chitinophagales bacterium]
MKEYKLPHTIQNKFGEKLTFLRITNNGSKEILEVENEVLPGRGPVMHVHYKQDESLTVAEGKLGYQILGGEEKFAGVGETITFNRGEFHRFWNAGDSILKCKGWISPPNNIIYYLENIYHLMDEGNGEPGGFDAAYLVTKYKSEFDVKAIPSFVKSVIFPAVIFFGKLSGKHKKFVDAPEAK